MDGKTLRSSLGRQITTFGGVGAVAAIGHYGAMIASVELGLLSAVAASLLGYLVGGTIAYTCHRRFTFRSRRAHEAAVPRFVVVAATGFVLTGLAMSLLIEMLSIHYIPAQLLTTGALMIWSFALNRGWTFREAPG